MLMTIHNNVDQTFWIIYFLCVFVFLTQKQVKIDNKKKKKKKKKQCKKKKKKTSYTNSQQSNVCPTIEKTNQDKEVKHTSHMRFKELYQHQWSYRVI